jgi:hypothetical protein
VPWRTGTGRSDRATSAFGASLRLWVDDGAMAATTNPAQGPLERFLSVDDKGVGMRASWRPAHGFVNLSLWQGDRCVEAFHLPPAEVARLTAFLATSLTGAMATSRAAPALRSVELPSEPGPGGAVVTVRRALTVAIARLRRRAHSR